MDGATRERGASPSGTRVGGGFVVASFLLALAASLVLLLAPLASEVSARVPVAPGPGDTGLEPGERVVRRRSLLETEGRGILVPLAIPVVVAGLPVLAAGSSAAGPLRAVAATLLPAWVLLGIASIGTLYVPSAASMAVAWARGRRRRSGEHP